MKRISKTGSGSALLRDSDIPDVVALHRSCLPYSVNSRLGSEHLFYVYKFMMGNPASLVQVARVDGHIAGVVSAALAPSELKSAMLANLKLRQKLTLAMQLFTKPGLLLALINNRKIERPVFWEGSVVTPVLTAIAVNNEVRRQGVGRILVDRVDEFMRANGARAYRLDTRSEKARAFYVNQGFAEVEKRGRDHILVKPLDVDHVPAG